MNSVSRGSINMVLRLLGSLKIDEIDHSARMMPRDVELKVPVFMGQEEYRQAARQLRQFNIYSYHLPFRAVRLDTQDFIDEVNKLIDNIPLQGENLTAVIHPPTVFEGHEEKQFLDKAELPQDRFVQPIRLCWEIHTGKGRVLRNLEDFDKYAGYFENPLNSICFDLAHIYDTDLARRLLVTHQRYISNISLSNRSSVDEHVSVFEETGVHDAFDFLRLITAQYTGANLVMEYRKPSRPSVLEDYERIMTIIQGNYQQARIYSVKGRELQQSGYLRECPSGKLSWEMSGEDAFLESLLNDLNGEEHEDGLDERRHAFNSDPYQRRFWLGKLHAAAEEVSHEEDQKLYLERHVSDEKPTREKPIVLEEQLF
jgi:hypothetical protein